MKYSVCVGTKLYVEQDPASHSARSVGLPRTDFDKIGMVPRIAQSGNYAFLTSKVSPVIQSTDCTPPVTYATKPRQ